MMLCIDVGNSQIYGGLFVDSVLKFRFRLTSRVSTSDEFGILLKAALRENNCDVERIRTISICSVVPQLDYSLRAACLKYFKVEPFFLQAGVKTGLNIKYRNPAEVGADRIANAIAASHFYPERHLIIVDFGTATTFCAVTAQKHYLGGVIMPGMRLSADSLAKNTAKLPSVEIIKPSQVIGRSTIESVQSGVFWGILGSCREIIKQMKRESFGDKTVTVIATGGFASLYESHEVYDEIAPDLVLNGVRIAADINTSSVHGERP